ncbi:Spy/CpxP family protein refolding chaperone [Candidatus Poribacteria bacterium]
MKKLNAILSIAIVMLLIAGSLVVAQEAEKPAKGRGAGPGFCEMCRNRMMGQGPGHMMGSGGRGMRRGPGGRQGGTMRGMRRGPGGGRGRATGRMGNLLHLADKLDLSEGQRNELSEILTSHRKDTIRQKAEIELAKVDLQKLTRQEDPNLDAVETQIREIANLEAGIKFSQIKIKVDTRNVLTEEQKTALKKIREDQQAKRKAGAEKPSEGRRMRRGPGPRQ